MQILKPNYKVIINNIDVTTQINKNTSFIEFRDEEGTLADEVTIKAEGLFKRPKKGDELKLYIGNQEELFFCGLFIVQNSKISQGQENQTSITATGADFSSDLKVKRSQSYENISLKDLANIIAKRHDLKVSSDLDDKYVMHIEQTNESDLHFLKRVAKENNALFAIKNSTVILKNKIKNNKKSSSLPRFYLPIKELENLIIETRNKTYYNSCKAIWRDTKENKTLNTVVGSGTPQLKLKDSFENLADAKAKATAALQKANSKTKTGDFKAAGFKAYAGGILIINGTIEDDGEYHITQITHTIDSNGWNMSMQVEN